jgi:hypothetical protein
VRRIDTPQKIFCMAIGVVGALMSLSLAGVRAADDQKTFKGILTDSQCAMNVHSLSQSHDEMLKSNEVGKTPEDCVWYCIKQRGGRFVLQAGKKVYKLDDQNISRALANKKVQIVGTLDSQSNTIHVLKILLPDGQPAS